MTDKMLDLTLYLGDATFTMKPESYTFSHSVDSGFDCYLRVVQENDADSMTTQLGIPFMETYVTTLNSSSNTMTF